jgi:DNA polymerase III delta prime subunit
LILESKNRRAIIALAENLRIMAAQSQLRKLSSKQRAEKESRKHRQMASAGEFS